MHYNIMKETAGRLGARLENYWEAAQKTINIIILLVKWNKKQFATKKIFQ